MSVTITINGTDYSVPSSAADTNWAANQVAWEQAVSTYVNSIGTAVALPTWHAPSLINSWTNFGAGTAPAAYSKDATGRVWLRGAISGGANGSVAFVLPAGFRPPYTQTSLIPVLSGVATASVDTSGNVTIQNLTSGSDCNTLTLLDQASFSTVA